MTMIARRNRCAGMRWDIRRRVAPALVLAAAILSSVALTAQAWGQTKITRVGVLSFSEVADDPNLNNLVTLTRHELANRGWVEGKNLSIEYRSAWNDPSRFPAAALELVELEVDVILAPSAPAVRAAYAATHTIPIVANDYTNDPLAEGYVESYARPGGNLTGIFLDAPEIAGKWFDLLSAIIPNLSRVAVLWDPAPGANHLRAVRTVANSKGISVQVVEVRKPDDIDRAFNALRGTSQAVILLPSPLIVGQSVHLAELTRKHRVLATSMTRDFALAGGTLAYGPEQTSADQRYAVFVARILAGAKPAELPVERPSKFELVVNLRTARALGFTIPQSILLGADEVIE